MEKVYDSSYTVGHEILPYVVQNRLRNLLTDLC
jgi:hypothetical protein